MKTYSLMLSKIFLIFTMGLLFFTCMNVPLLGDGMRYTDWVLDPPFKLSRGFSPGRHSAEVLAIFTNNIVAPLLGRIMTPLNSLIFSYTIISFILLSLLYYVSTSYIQLHQKSTTRYFFMGFFFFISFFLATLFNPNPSAPPLFVWSYMGIIMTWGAMSLGLAFWLIFVYYIEHEKLPFDMEDSPYQAYGFSLPIIYFVTQMHDGTSPLLLAMSGLFLCYLLMLRVAPQCFEQKTKPSNLVMSLVITYIVFILFSLIRTKFLGDRADGITYVLNPIEWFHRMAAYFPRAQNFLYLFTSIYGVYLLLKSWRKKYITSFDVLTLILIISVFASLIINLIAKIPPSQSQWMSWIVLLRISFMEFQKKNKFVMLVMPIIVFSTILYALIPMRDYIREARLRANDYKYLIEAFQYADENNLSEVYIPRPQVKQLVPLWWPGWQDSVSRWMYNNGYTSKFILLIPDTRYNSCASSPEVFEPTHLEILMRYFEAGNTTKFVLLPEDKEWFYNTFQDKPYWDKITKNMILKRP